MFEGITDDHQFKTRDGWKYFHEIDIEKDELYSWYFDAPTYDCDHVDVAELYYNYKCIEEAKGKYVDIPQQKYIKPLKKEFYLMKNCDLYKIKNDFIDLTVTSNYILPTIYIDESDRYGNYCDIDSIDKIYQNAKKWNLNENEDLCVKAFSEILIKDGNYENYQLNKLVFKLEHSNFEKIKARDKSIVNFVMPGFKNEFISWRVYVRRNGKEFWI